MPLSTVERAAVSPPQAIPESYLHVHLQAFVDRRRDPHNKKDAVLHVAVRLFLERGFWRTSLSDVARQLKITKPALYHYFRSKEEIYLECYRRGIALIQNNLDRLRGCGGNGADKVAGFIYAYAVLIASDFGRCVVRQDDRELSREARAEVRSYKRAVDGCLRAFIQEGISDGSLRPCDVKLAAFSITGAVNSLAVWFEPDRGLTAAEVAEEFARTLIEGLALRRRGSVKLPDWDPFNLVLTPGARPGPRKFSKVGAEI
jgi:AcrR family transcriptional regulator